MKRNRKTYLLLAMVAAIWGILGFRLLRAIDPVPDPLGPIGNTILFIMPTGKEKDTFSILANYRDPFLGTMPPDLSPKSSGPRPLPKKEPAIDIRYTGFVKEKGSGNSIFFVHIDGEQRMLSRDESYGTVKLLSGDGDRIKVRANGTNLTIARTK